MNVCSQLRKRKDKHYLMKKARFAKIRRSGGPGAEKARAAGLTELQTALHLLRGQQVQCCFAGF